METGDLQSFRHTSANPRERQLVKDIINVLCIEGAKLSPGEVTLGPIAAALPMICTAACSNYKASVSMSTGIIEDLKPYLVVPAWLSMSDTKDPMPNLVRRMADRMLKAARRKAYLANGFNTETRSAMIFAGVSVILAHPDCRGSSEQAMQLAQKLLDRVQKEFPLPNYQTGRQRAAPMN